MAIADDTGRTVPVGEVGRVRLRSGAVMRGYWGGPTTGPGAAGVVYDRQATEAVLAEDGWLTTGDFGYTDPTGCLHLVGRANELYIRGGYNVYPAEVEGGTRRTSRRGPGGGGRGSRPRPGRDRGGLRGAAAGTEPDEAGLLAALRDRARASLADYKAPDRVVVVDSLPLTSMMKVDKRSLADRAEAAARVPPATRPGQPRPPTI